MEETTGMSDFNTIVRQGIQLKENIQGKYSQRERIENEIMQINIELEAKLKSLKESELIQDGELEEEKPEMNLRFLLV